MSDKFAELQQLAEVAGKLAKGELSARVELPDLSKREDDLGLLGRSLNQLADTLKLNLNRLERRLRQLWRLIDIERDLAGLLEPTNLLARLPAAAAEILEVEAAFLMVTEQPNLDAMAVAWPREEGASEWLWLREKTEQVSHTGIPQRFRAAGRGMAVPLEVRPMAGGNNRDLQVIGALGVARGDSEKPFDSDDQMLLFALAGSAGLAIERSRLLAASEQSRLRGLMESMKEGVILVEAPAGRVRMANAAARHLLGWTQEANLLSPNHPAEVRLIALANKVEETGRSGGEEEIIFGNRVVNARATLAQSLAGQQVGCVITLVDITLQRQTEQLREDLSAMMVHDLRTPLTVIIGALETLAAVPGGEDLSLQQEMVEMGLSGANSLLAMVNTLLDISRLESGEMPLERNFLGVEELTKAALSQVSQLAKKGKIELRLELDADLAPVWGDREKLQRVLVNLLGNAIKFTPEGGRIVLSACDDSARGWVLFSVTDTGEGVPEEYLDRVFDKFEQVAGRKAGRKMSTGLGLTFCRLAVEAQGGKIWVESPAFPQDGPDSPKGSRFTFTVPIREK